MIAFARGSDRGPFPSRAAEAAKRGEALKKSASMAQARRLSIRSAKTSVMDHSEQRRMQLLASRSLDLCDASFIGAPWISQLYANRNPCLPSFIPRGTRRNQGA